MQPLPLSGGGVRRPAEPETPDAPPARRSRTVSESVPRSTPQLLADAERALLGRSPIAGDVSDAERTAPATTPATPDSQPTPPTEPSFALTTPEMSFDEQHAQQADTPQRDFVEEEEEPWWETPAERDPRKSDTPRRAHVADTAPAAPAQEVPAVAEPNVQGEFVTERFVPFKVNGSSLKSIRFKRIFKESKFFGSFSDFTSFEIAFHRPMANLFVVDWSFRRR